MTDKLAKRAIQVVAGVYLVWMFYHLVQTERGCDERSDDRKRRTCRFMSFLWGAGVLVFVKTTLCETVPRAMK